MIAYRIARIEDAEALAELRWEFQSEEASDTTELSRQAFLQACSAFFVKSIERGDWVHWVADDDGTLVACICLLTIVKIPKPGRLHDTFGYVTNVYTRPAYRNQGIGTELMRQVIGWAKERDLENLIVWPSERSVPFYERAGFVPDKEMLELPLRPSVYL